MTIPEHFGTRWVASLTDKQLASTETKLFNVFHKENDAEKNRRGTRYMLLQGPPTLVNAWHRWVLVNNESRQRGLVIHRGR